MGILSVEVSGGGTDRKVFSGTACTESGFVVYLPEKT